MKLLRLKLFQETACYLKPFAFKVGETFPLAPFSTVKGMLHAVLDAQQYIPMNLSIQGQAESHMIDYQKKYIYKKSEVPALVTMDGLTEAPQYDDKLFSTMPMYQHLLFNVEHVIHIEADDNVLQQIYDQLCNLTTTLSLGRWEDLVRIDEVCFVEAEEKDLESTLYSQYIPIQQEVLVNFENRAAYYRLPRKYEAHNGRRDWDYLSVIYIQKDTLFEDEVLSDGQYSIFLMKG